MGAILVVMGNGLWLVHQDWVVFGWLTKQAEIPWSEATKKAAAYKNESLILG